MKPRNACSCATCSAGCEDRPGWLVPTDLPAIAALLNLTVDALFGLCLQVDWWAGAPHRLTRRPTSTVGKRLLEMLDPDHDGQPPTFVLAPALTSCRPGTVYPYVPFGRCSFYVNGRCCVHADKPAECALVHHDDDARRHADIAELWKPHQDEIRRLLGRDPVATEATLDDVLLMDKRARKR